MCLIEKFLIRNFPSKIVHCCVLWMTLVVSIQIFIYADLRQRRIDGLLTLLWKMGVNEFCPSYIDNSKLLVSDQLGHLISPFPLLPDDVIPQYISQFYSFAVA